MATTGGQYALSSFSLLLYRRHLALERFQSLVHTSRHFLHLLHIKRVVDEPSKAPAIFRVVVPRMVQFIPELFWVGE
jgi:hypothetical protein